MFVQFLRALTAKLLENLLELLLENFDNLVATLGPHGAYAKHGSAAEEGKLGTRCHRHCDIRAGANAAIHHDLDPTLELLGKFGNGLDRGLTLIELPTAVVGDGRRKFYS